MTEATTWNRAGVSPGNRFRGEILPKLFDLVEKKIVRDLVFIMKDQAEVIGRELRELDPAHRVFDPLQADVSQMITDSDIA